MEVCFAILQQFFARFQFDETLSDRDGGSSARPTLWPADGFAVCAVSRQLHFIGTDWISSPARNGANRKRWAIFPRQHHAVALLHYLQQSTRHACSLNFPSQPITQRRATLGYRHMGFERCERPRTKDIHGCRHRRMTAGLSLWAQMSV